MLEEEKELPIEERYRLRCQAPEQLVLFAASATKLKELHIYSQCGSQRVKLEFLWGHYKEPKNADEDKKKRNKTKNYV